MEDPKQIQVTALYEEEVEVSERFPGGIQRVTRHIRVPKTEKEFEKLENYIFVEQHEREDVEWKLADNDLNRFLVRQIWDNWGTDQFLQFFPENAFERFEVSILGAFDLSTYELNQVKEIMPGLVNKISNAFEQIYRNYEA